MIIKKIEAMYHYFGHGEGKCGDCSNLCTYTASRTWYKCKVYGESNSEATDNDREEVQVEGQISLFEWWKQWKN